VLPLKKVKLAVWIPLVADRGTLAAEKKYEGEGY